MINNILLWIDSRTIDGVCYDLIYPMILILTVAAMTAFLIFAFSL